MIPPQYFLVHCISCFVWSLPVGFTGKIAFSPASHDSHTCECQRLPHELRKTLTLRCCLCGTTDAKLQCVWMTTSSYRNYTIILDVDWSQDTRDISSLSFCCDVRKVRVLTVLGDVSGTKFVTNTHLPPHQDNVTCVTAEMNWCILWVAFFFSHSFCGNRVDNPWEVREIETHKHSSSSGYFILCGKFMRLSFDKASWTGQHTKISPCMRAPQRVWRLWSWHFVGHLGFVKRVFSFPCVCCVPESHCRYCVFPETCKLSSTAARTRATQEPLVWEGLLLQRNKHQNIIIIFWYSLCV